MWTQKLRVISLIRIMLKRVGLIHRIEHTQNSLIAVP